MVRNQDRRRNRSNLSEPNTEAANKEQNRIIKKHGESSKSRPDNLSSTPHSKSPISPISAEEFTRRDLWTLRKESLKYKLVEGITEETAAPIRNAPIVKGAKIFEAPVSSAAKGPTV
jgi:hypothetical protein